MEKLLNIPKEKFGDKTSYRLYRLQCECPQAIEALGIDVESYNKDNEGKSITLRLDVPNSLTDRLSLAWNVLFKGWGWRDFCVREEDFKPLSEIFNPNKKYSELP